MTFSASFVILESTPPPLADLTSVRGYAPLGRVVVGPGCDVLATDPVRFRLLAAAFTEAARLLSTELDKQAARDMRGQT